MATQALTVRAAHRLIGLLLCVVSVVSLAQPAPAQPTPAEPISVKGTGATFPLLVYLQWAKVFEKESGIQVQYLPKNSSEGVAKIKAQAVDFGGTDIPLSAEELSKHHLVQLPMLVGGLVPVVNLPGIADTRLQLTGEVFAGLMMGKIRQWNDPLIASLNPGVTLPSLPVHRVVNGGPSGSVLSVTTYLSSVSEAFKADVGMSATPTWPGSVERANSTDAIAAAVQARPGAIGFLSFDRVVQHKLTSVKLRNADGNFVAASEQAFRYAIARSDMALQNNDQASLLSQPGALSWPITMTTYVLFSATPENGQEASHTLKFLYWCFLRGDEKIRGTGFSPLPMRMQSKLVSRFAEVKPKDKVRVDYVSQ